MHLVCGGVWVWKKVTVTESQPRGQSVRSALMSVKKMSTSSRAPQNGCPRHANKTKNRFGTLRNDPSPKSACKIGARLPPMPPPAAPSMGCGACHGRRARQHAAQGSKRMNRNTDSASCRPSCVVNSAWGQRGCGNVIGIELTGSGCCQQPNYCEDATHKIHFG